MNFLSRTTNRNVLIDVVRGASVINVFLGHYTGIFHYPFSLYALYFLKGYYAVSAFFCMSGYLISSKYISNDFHFEIKSILIFYRNRFGRIVPPLALFLTIVCTLSFSGISGFAIPYPLRLVQFISATVTLRFDSFLFKGGDTVTAWVVLWSLMIEEKFYLLFPFVLLLSRKPRVIAVIMGALCIIGPIVRASGRSACFSAFGCFDCISIGVLAALWVKNYSHRTAPAAYPIMLMAGVTLVSIVFMSTKLNQPLVYHPSLVAIGSGLIMVASHRIRLSPLLILLYPISQIGRVSYEFYLFHLPILVFMRWLLAVTPENEQNAILAMNVTLIFSASLLIHSVVSEPLNRFLRRTMTGPAKERAFAAPRSLS